VPPGPERRALTLSIEIRPPKWTCFSQTVTVFWRVVSRGGERFYERTGAAARLPAGPPPPVRRGPCHFPGGSRIRKLLLTSCPAGPPRPAVPTAANLSSGDSASEKKVPAGSSSADTSDPSAAFHTAR